MRRSLQPLRFLTRLSAQNAWWVIGVWVVLAAALNITAPQIEQTASEKSAPVVPSDLPATHESVRMFEDFKTPTPTAAGAIVLASESGFGEPEDSYYRQLVQRLSTDTDHVSFLLDMYGNPVTRDLTVSPDGKAVILTLGERGDVGTAQAHASTTAIRDHISAIPRPPGLQVHLSGPGPTVVDEFAAMETSMVVITAVSVLLIVMLLIGFYRSLWAAAVPLMTIGIALGASRAVVSALGWNEILPVSTLTISLMTALVLAAGTDYAIFQIEAFHEARRRGNGIVESVLAGGRSVGEVLTASALTVAASASALVFAKIGMFTTSGPAIAVSLIVTLAVSLTFTPAVITVLGRRGLIEPRAAADRVWRRRGARILRHARVATAASLALLLALAAPLLSLAPSGNDNAMQLRATDSSQGYEAVARHYPANEVLPEYLVIRADHDMRNTEDLAALERASQAVSDLPEVAYVRSITRPDGNPLRESSTGYQTGIIGDRLGDAQRRVAGARPELARLAAGLTALRDGAHRAQQQLPELVSGTQQLVALADSVVDLLPLATRLASATTSDGRSLSDVLAQVQGMTADLQAIAQTISRHTDALHTLRGVLAPLSTPAPNPECLAQPSCQSARALFGQLDAATGGALRAATVALDLAVSFTPETVTSLNALLPDLRAGLDTLNGAVARIDNRSPAQLRSDLHRLQKGMGQLSEGMSQLADGLTQADTGTSAAVDMTDELSSGLREAVDYLTSMAAATSTGPASGFYLPPQAFSQDRFLQGAHLLMSDDGRSVRILVMLTNDPYGTSALPAPAAIVAAAYGSLQGSTLSRAEVTSTGLASVTGDLIDQTERDFTMFAVVASLAIFIILVFLLRSLVAPVVLVATVILSFASAAGISVLVWQHLVGINLHWSVLPVTFMCLVAIGADYSMLFASRVREASTRGTVQGILRAFGTTGKVITTAGIVFAVTMFALMSGSVVLLAQTGFTVGVGLLIDIAIVRTVLVPSVLFLLGKRAWWPSEPPVVAQ